MMMFLSSYGVAQDAPLGWGSTQRSLTPSKWALFAVPLRWEMSDSRHGEQIPGWYEPAALGGHSRGEVRTFWFSEIHWSHLFLKGTCVNLQ